MHQAPSRDPRALLLVIKTAIEAKEFERETVESLRQFLERVHSDISRCLQQ